MAASRPAVWRSLFLCAAAVFAAALASGRDGPPPRIVSGPMVVEVAHRSAAVWLEVEKPEAFTVEYWSREVPRDRRGPSAVERVETPLGTTILKFTLSLLEPGQTYAYAVLSEKRALELGRPTGFSTRPLWEFRREAPDFRFLAGSCAYLNDEPYDRPGKPYGGPTAIFSSMAASGADFMLWLGDNVYLREVDYSSRHGIWYRWSHDRAHPDMQALLGAMPHWFIWDDHDYGPNDANRSFVLKEESLAAFRAYCPNPSAGERDNPGIYTQFRWGDADFFLLDGRYDRDESWLKPAVAPEKALLGERQLAWLQNALARSNADSAVRVRFICLGSQVLNPQARKESYAQFPRERQALLDWLLAARISGVVFLTGDRHYSELLRQERRDAPPLLDLTSSPLTSRVADGPLAPESWPERDNPLRVEGTLAAVQNYCEVALSGSAEERLLTLRCRSADGVEIWSRSYPVQDLQFMPQP